MAAPLTPFDGKRIVKKYDILSLNRSGTIPSHRAIPIAPYQIAVFNLLNGGNGIYAETSTGWFAHQFADNSIEIQATDGTVSTDAGVNKIWPCVSDTNNAVYGNLIGLVYGESEVLSVDISTCTALDYFVIYASNLPTIDLTKNTLLTYLYLSYNSLTSLDVTNCPLLSSLECVGNSLTSLDITNCPLLTYLDCNANSLTQTAVDTILSTLVAHGLEGDYLVDLGSNSPPTDYTNVDILNGRGWTVTVAV